MPPRFATLFALLAPALLASACGREGNGRTDALVEKAIEASSEPADAGAGDGGNGGIADIVTIETEEGLYTATSGEDLPLPAQFPDDITLPVDARVLTSMTLGPALSVSLRCPRSLPLVFDEFRAAQRAAGWREDEAIENAPVQSLGFEKGGRRLEANFVAEPAGGTTLAISLRPVAD